MIADTIDKILELKEQGKTKKEIAQELEISTSTIRVYLNLRVGIDSIKKIEQIKKAISKGYQTSNKISEQTGIISKDILKLSNANRIKLQKNKFKRIKKTSISAPEYLKEIDNLAKNNYTLQEVLAKVEMTQKQLNDYYILYGKIVGVSYKEFIYNTAKNKVLTRLYAEPNLQMLNLTKEPELNWNLLGKIGEEYLKIDGEKIKIKEFLYDDFLLKGKTLQKVKKILACNSMENARQYINITGQYDTWMESKKKISEKNKTQKIELKNERTNLVSLIAQKAINECNGEWAKETAVLVYLKKQKTCELIPLEKLIMLFEAYEFSEKYKIPTSLSLLAKYSNLSCTKQAKIQLKYAGIESLRNKQ